MMMSKAEIHAGICGFTTTVQATMNGSECQLQIISECKAIQQLAENLASVDPFTEISFRRSIPLTYDIGMKYCTHAACPVPSGVIKAIEVEAGLALPADVTIKLTKE
jgi:hypothetical protein